MFCYLHVIFFELKARIFFLLMASIFYIWPAESRRKKGIKIYLGIIVFFEWEIKNPSPVIQVKDFDVYLSLVTFYFLSRNMVCSRLGPTEAMETGTPISSSIKLM